MAMQTKLLIGLVALGLVDVVIPIPILGVILIYVLTKKPLWFREMVRTIYQE